MTISPRPRGGPDQAPQQSGPVPAPGDQGHDGGAAEARATGPGEAGFPGEPRAGIPPQWGQPPKPDEPRQADGPPRLGEPGQADGPPSPGEPPKAGEPPKPGEPPEQGQPPKPGRSRHRRRSKRRSFWRELPILIVIALGIALLIKSFVVQAFFIPTGSMEDTLDVGDKVLVNKLVYDFRSIQPGDIVVFNGQGSWDPAQSSAPGSSNLLVRLYDDTLKPVFSSIAQLFGTAPGQTDYIKRVIGVPGDHVVCCNAHGLITVNGVPLHEQSYLYPGNKPSSSPTGSGRFNITVPPGRLWVLGDHRSISDDSRGHRADPGGGTIPESAVIGRAFLIIWPPSRWRVLNIPGTFLRPGVERTASLGAARSPGPAIDALGTAVVPGAPYLPLTGGVVGAVPLTLLQRRLRQRWRRRRSAG